MRLERAGVHAALHLAALGAVVGIAHAQPQPIASGVYRWTTLVAERDGEGGRVIRRIVRGPTTDLAMLEVHATTLPTKLARETAVAADDSERVVIVRDGTLRVTLGDSVRTLGPHSVAIRPPGVPMTLASATGAPVTYYVLTYRAKAAPDAARAQGHPWFADWATQTAQPTDVGTRRQPFDQPTTLFGRFEMHVSTVDAGLTNHPVHTHRAEEFVLMIGGTVRMVIGDTRQTATTGDLIFLASNVPHALDNIGRDVTTYFAFQGTP